MNPDQVVAAVKGRAQHEVLAAQGGKGGPQKFGADIRTVGTDKQQPLHLPLMTADGGPHPAADITLRLLSILMAIPQPGDHLRRAAALIMDFQAVRMENRQRPQPGKNPLGHFTVETGGPIRPQCRNQPGLALSGLRISGKEDDKIRRVWNHYKSESKPS